MLCAQAMLNDPDYYVPSTGEREELLAEVRAFGHNGHNAMTQELHERRVKWINMQKDCCEFIKAHITCQRANIAKRVIIL